MSKRAWLIFFWSMGLALLPAQSQPARNSNAAQLQSSVTKTKTASATASLPIEVRQDLHAIAGALKAANAKPPSSTDERNASAQEKVARLTPKMIGIAAIEAAITLVGVILVAFTLQATRQTKNEAKRAADAAHATLAHMQSNAKMELRAYLSVEPLGIAALDDWARAVGHVAVRNVGKVPAKSVSITVKLVTAPDRNVELFFAEDLETTQRVIQPSVFVRQGSDQYLPTVHMGPKKREYIYVYGVAYYGDGFGQRRFTRFCHRYDVTSFDHNWRRADNEDRTIIRPEKARYHTNGNEAD